MVRAGYLIATVVAPSSGQLGTLLVPSQFNRQSSTFRRCAVASTRDEDRGAKASDHHARAMTSPAAHLLSRSMPCIVS